MILYIDACAREASRTRKLADALVSRLTKEEPDQVVTRVLYREADQFQPLTEDRIRQRDEAYAKQDFSDPIFRYAEEFASADRIVIAAPYWDFSFPAILKLYLEHVSVSGITFHYKEDGEPVGHCRADMLYYVTTAGGEIGSFNYGYDYVKLLTRGLFGVRDTQCIRVVGLDLAGTDADILLERAVRNIIESVSGI